MNAFDDNKFRNDGTVEDFYTADLFNKYKHSYHLNETRGECGSTNNILKTINILIRQLKVNKLEINKNITTHVTKMPKTPPQNPSPLELLDWEYQMESHRCMIVNNGIAAKWKNINLSSVLKLSEEILQDYETVQQYEKTLNKPKDPRQDEIKINNIKKFEFTNKQNEHNDKIKQINISKKQPKQIKTNKQTQTTEQHEQQHEQQHYMLQKMIKEQLEELNKIILPRITHKKQDNIQGTKHKNTEIHKLKCRDNRGNIKTMEENCKEHQILNKRGISKNKQEILKQTKNQSTDCNINIVQHINNIVQTDTVNKTHKHDSIFAPTENTKYLMEHILTKTKMNTTYPIIIYYDTLASCSLLDDGNNKQIRDILDTQEQIRTEITRFAGCNTESVDKEIRVLEVILIGKNNNITVNCYAKDFPAPIATCPAQQGKYTPTDLKQLTCKNWEKNTKNAIRK